MGRSNLELSEKEIEEKANLLLWTRWVRVRNVKEPKDLLESIARHEDSKTKVC